MTVKTTIPVYYKNKFYPPDSIIVIDALSVDEAQSIIPNCIVLDPPVIQPIANPDNINIPDFTPIIKRGRGRPRKYPLTNIGDSNNEN